MQRASRRVKSTTSDFERAAAAAQKFAMAAGAVAVAFATSTAAIVVSAAKAMDATSKMAQQVGVTTEALTGMRFAAQQFANISDQQFDQAMRRMTRRIEEAAAGSGSAKKALEEMGLSAQELSRMTPDRQMLALADAMKRTESQANRLRYTMAIFDTEGMALVPALQQGAAAFEDNIKLAERYGVVLSTEAAQAAEQFTTNLSHLGAMMDGLKIQLASEILPTINQFITNVIQATTEVDGLHSEVKSLSTNSAFKEWFDASSVGLARIADVAVFVAKAVGTVGLAFQSAAADVQAGLAWIGKPNAADKLLMPAEDYNRLVAEYDAAMNHQASTVGRFNQTLDDLLTYQGNKFEQAAITAVNTIRVTSGQIKLVDLTTKDSTKSTDANTTASKKNTAALTEAQRAAQAFRREQDQGLRAQLAAVSAIHQQAQGLEDQVLLFGLGKTAIEDLTIARLVEQSNLLAIYGGDKAAPALAAIEAEIEARKRLRAGIGSLEAKEAEKASWAAWAQDVEQIFQQVGQSLSDAIFDGGKSGRDLVKDLFKTLTLRVLINPVMGALQGAVTNSLGGMFGYSNPAQGGGVLGMASNASSAYSAANGGMAGNLSSAINWAGEKLGSSALQSFASGLAGTAWTASTPMYSLAASALPATAAWAGGAAGLVPAASGLFAGPGLAASLSTTVGTTGAVASGGAAGLGAMAGAALPWIGGALAIGSLLSGSFKGESRYGGSYNWTPEAGTVRGKWDDGDPGAEANKAISAILDGAVATINSAFEGVGSQAALSYFMGWAESSEKGRGGTASGGRLAVNGNEYAFGTTRKGQGYGDTSGDLGQMIENMTVDIYQTIIQAWQLGIDEFPTMIQDMLRGIDADSLGAEQAQALAAQIQAIIQQVSAFQVAVEQLPFENLKQLSFDAAAGLIAAAGGLENLNAGMTSYYTNFYSQQEQLDFAARQMGASFESLGLVMPDVTQGADAAKAAYRALVESLDPTTEAGQQATATLYALAGGFAELVVGMDELNSSVQTVETGIDSLAVAAGQFKSAAMAAQRAMQMMATGGSLADRLGGMLGLAPVFGPMREQELWATIGSASYEQQIDMAGELTDIVLNRINKEQEANQQRIAGLREEITTLSRMRDLGASLQTYLRSLESSNLAPYSLQEKVGIAEGELATLVKAAKGGDENAMRQVQGALQNALSLWREYGASGAEYQDAYHRLTGMVGNLASSATSEAARQIAQLEAQAAALEGISGYSAEQLAQLQQLYDITTAATQAAQAQYQSDLANANTELAQLEKMGLDTARLHEVVVLLQGLPASLAAQITGASSGGLQYMIANPDVKAAFEQYGQGTAGDFALQHYGNYGQDEGRAYNGNRGEQYLANNPDVMNAYLRGDFGDMAADAAAKYHWENYGKDEGRSYAVGTSYVPHDMTANIHRGEIIIDPRSSDVLRNYGINVQSQGGGEVTRLLQGIMQRLDSIQAQGKELSREEIAATVAATKDAANTIVGGVGGSLRNKTRDDAQAQNRKRSGILA